MTKKFTRVGMVARWQPVHMGHAAVLNALCERAEFALIGVGSANEHTLRAPFTYSEVSAMIRLVLEKRSNYRILAIPDLHDGPRWRKMVAWMFGELDIFLTDNPYVASLMGQEYPVVRPVDLLTENQRIPLDGTHVRLEMARGSGWKPLVPPAVADFIIENRLDERFRREFGLQTLAGSILLP